MYTKFSLTIIVINDFELSRAWQKRCHKLVQCPRQANKLTLRAIKLKLNCYRSKQKILWGSEVDQLKMNLEHKKGIPA